MGSLVFELIRSPVVVAEQLRFFRSQLLCSRHDVTCIELATVAISRERGLHDALAQLPVL